MSELRVTRKVKQGPVDIDVDDCALIVNYEIETVSQLYNTFSLYCLNDSCVLTGRS